MTNICHLALLVSTFLSFPQGNSDFLSASLLKGVIRKGRKNYLDSTNCVEDDDKNRKNFL